MQTPNDRLHLTTAKYLPEKRSMAVEFQNIRSRRTERFAFFPTLLLPSKVIQKEFLETLLKGHNLRFKINTHENALEISAATFSGLKKIRNAVISALKITPMLLQPERQFLLWKGWSYFDCFEFTNNDIVKLNNSLPEVHLDFLSDSLPKTLKELLAKDQKSAEMFAEKITLSNILAVPLEQLPQQKFHQLEIFLENSYFKNKFVPTTEEREITFNSIQTPRGTYPEITEIDFSLIWPTLLTSPFYNIGPDSLNCGCCKPADSNARNVLPNSTAEVEFLEDGIYFESYSPDFSLFFHNSNDMKENRLKRMNEFYLQAIPSGPFLKGRKQSIPLPDAQHLEKQNLVKSSNRNSLKWFCTRTESLLSKEVCALNQKIHCAQKYAKAEHHIAVQNHRLMATLQLQKSENYLYHQSCSKTLCNFLDSLTTHLLNQNSRFFSPILAETLRSIQFSVLHRFKEFTNQNGSRFIHSDKYRAFIDSEAPLHITKEFAERENLPQPAINCIHKTLSFS